MGKIIEIRLKQILKERDIEQKEIAKKTGLTERTISELCNNKVKRIPKEAIEKIATELELDSIEQLITMKDEEE